MVLEQHMKTATGHRLVHGYTHRQTDVGWGGQKIQVDRQTGIEVQRDRNTDEPRHVKTNKMSVRPAKIQISLSIRQVCPHEESLGPKLPIKRTAKTLIRLGGCPG